MNDTQQNLIDALRDWANDHEAAGHEWAAQWLRDHYGIETTPMSITCPQCMMTSYHPKDIEHGYCGNCHAFTREDRPWLVICLLCGYSFPRDKVIDRICVWCRGVCQWSY